MTTEQEQRIRDAIASDCALKCAYFDREDPSKTCIIGALIAPGFRTQVLEYRNASSVSALDEEIVEQLKLDTGLTVSELADLQMANDESNDDERRDNVLEMFERILKVRAAEPALTSD